MTMTGNRYDDLDEALARLAPHDARPERVDRVRDRCHAALAARVPERHATTPRPWLPAGALGVCSIYLAAAVQVSVAFLRAVSR